MHEKEAWDLVLLRSETTNVGIPHAVVKNDDVGGFGSAAVAGVAIKRSERNLRIIFTL